MKKNILEKWIDVPARFDCIENSGSYVTNSPEFFKGQFPTQRDTIKEIVHKYGNVKDFGGEPLHYRFVSSDNAVKVK